MILHRLFASRPGWLRVAITVSLALVASVCRAPAQSSIPRYAHVVVVILENHSYGDIIGNIAQAPNINALAAGGALFGPAAGDPTGLRSGSHGLRHPSQPNYLELFSGSNQGVVQDGRPGTPSEPFSAAPPFTTGNLGASMIRAGYSFRTFSQNLPSVGFDGDSYTTNPSLTQYERKHNPAVNWQSAAANPASNNFLLPSTNQPFSAFPTTAAGFAQLPTLSLVVPDQQNDMHDGTIQMGDAWVQANLIEGYLTWARENNSLLILTFDEDGYDKPGDATTSNLIPTIFAGANIKPGLYGELDINPLDVRVADGFITPTGTAMNHYNVLRTLEDMYGLTPLGGSAGVPAITNVFVVPEPSALALAGIGGASLGVLALASWWRRRQAFRRDGGRKKRRRKVVAMGWLGLLLLWVSATVVRAQTVVAPNALANQPGDTPNLFPLFPGAGSPLRYQQVFGASQFSAFGPGGALITQLAFRPDSEITTPFSGAIPSIQIRLSTTAAAVDNLDPIFANNLGTDATIVFGAAPLTLAGNTANSTSPTKSFDVVILFTTPFLYDPSKGNLLLEVFSSQGGDTVPTERQLDGSISDTDATSRLFASGDANATTGEADTLGVVTQFTATPVPEPGTWAVLALGLSAGFAVTGARRRCVPAC